MSIFHEGRPYHPVGWPSHVTDAEQRVQSDASKKNKKGKGYSSGVECEINDSAEISDQNTDNEADMPNTSLSAAAASDEASATKTTGVAAESEGANATKTTGAQTIEEKGTEGIESNTDDEADTGMSKQKTDDEADTSKHTFLSESWQAFQTRLDAIPMEHVPPALREKIEELKSCTV